MPRRDGSGPTGAGPLTGRGWGYCTSGNPIKFSTSLAIVGLGLGLVFACKLYSRTSKLTKRSS